MMVAAFAAFDWFRGDEMMKEDGVELSACREENDKLRRKLSEIRDALAEIVISEGDDAGVILLSAESTTHHDPQFNCRVYDHEYFSPLGDALVAVVRLATEE